MLIKCTDNLVLHCRNINLQIAFVVFSVLVVIVFRFKKCCQTELAVLIIEPIMASLQLLRFLFFPQTPGRQESCRWTTECVFALSVPEAIILLYASTHAAQVFLVDVGWFPSPTGVFNVFNKKLKGKSHLHVSMLIVSLL